MTKPTLLTPSLNERLPKRGYSARSLFVLAFLGGPLPAVLFAGLNARDWNRLPRDYTLLVALGLLSIPIGVFLGYQTTVSPRGVRFAVRFVALAMAGILWLRHLPLYRAQEHSELPLQKPWVTGIACSMVGGAVMVGAALIGHALR